MSCGVLVAKVDSGEDGAGLYTLRGFISPFGCEFRFYKRSLVHPSNYRLRILASKKLVMLQVNFQPSTLPKVTFPFL